MANMRVGETPGKKLLKIPYQIQDIHHCLEGFGHPSPMNHPPKGWFILERELMVLYLFKVVPIAGLRIGVVAHSLACGHLCSLLLGDRFFLFLSPVQRENVEPLLLLGRGCLSLTAIQLQ